MKILVDTSVWSIALRHKSKELNTYTTKLYELIQDDRVIMLGPIRQEMLSGIKDNKEFLILKKRLADFVDLKLESTHYEKAAEYYNLCRTHGIQGSHTDFLICAVANSEEVPIFTTDKDFDHYATILPIILYNPSSK